MARANKSSTVDLIELTQDAFNELQEELNHRKTTLRDEIATSIAEARDLGDLSENHPYKVAMEKRELNENRIVDLESMLKNAHVVSSSTSTDVVTIGKTVVLVNKKTKKARTFVLVGSEVTESADPKLGKISVDSPIGKAIFKAKLGDVVTVELPAGNIEYEIREIK